MKINVELTTEERAELLERAPRACGYWATMAPYGASGALAVSTADNEGKPTVLRPDALDRGVALALAESSTAAQIARFGSLAACDLTLVDAVIQLALYGEILFG